MEKSRKSYLGLRPIILLLIVGFIFIVSIRLTFVMLDSRKPQEYNIPNFIGLKINEVEAKAREMGITLNVTEEYSTKVEEGTIISQTPHYVEEFKITEGSNMEVVVSLGEKYTIVPKVVGCTFEEAKQKIEQTNLKYRIVEVYNDEVEKNIVIEQSIEANSQVEKNTEVSITVSLGLEQE